MLTVDYDILSLSAEHRILDAGCGTGRHSMEARRRGATVFSMDIDIPSLIATKINLQKVIGTVKPGMVHSGDALRMPFRDATFDRIICSEVMEHVPDENLACAELSRILKDDGIIAITVPTTFSEALYFILTVEYFTSPGGHVRIFTPSRLAKIMEKNGLSVFAIRYKHSFHTIWWAIRSVVGLHREDQIITRWYRKFLTLGLFSRFMRKIESFFDWFFPKSVILYAVKNYQKPQGAAHDAKTDKN